MSEKNKDRLISWICSIEPIISVICTPINVVLSIIKHVKVCHEKHVEKINDRRLEWSRFLSDNYCVYCDVRGIRNMLIRDRDYGEDTELDVKNTLTKCFTGYSMIRGCWIKFNATETSFEDTFVDAVQRINDIGRVIDEYIRIIDSSCDLKASLLRAVSCFVAKWNMLERCAASQIEKNVKDVRAESEALYLGR